MMFWYILIGLIMSLFVDANVAYNGKQIDKWFNLATIVLAWPIFFILLVKDYFNN